MEWPETEETQNTDRSSISSNTSNHEMVGITNTKSKNDNSNGCIQHPQNGITTHMDSQSDEELSDFSLNFSDDEEYKLSNSSNRK